MTSATVRISEKTRNTLKELAAQSSETMQAVLDKAIEAYRRQCFLEEANQAYARLRGNRKASQSEVEERKAWDTALADGLVEK